MVGLDDLRGLFQPMILVAHYCNFPKHITSNTFLQYAVIRNTKQFQHSKDSVKEQKLISSQSGLQSQLFFSHL